MRRRKLWHNVVKRGESLMYLSHEVYFLPYEWAAADYSYSSTWYIGSPGEVARRLVRMAEKAP